VIFDGFGNLVVPRAFKIFPREVNVLEHFAITHPWQVLDPRHYAVDHRKILVVDGRIGFLGGYNIGSEYATQWRDTHLRIQGPGSAQLVHFFVDFWNRHHPAAKAIARLYPRLFDPLLVPQGNDAMRLSFPIRDMYIAAIDRAEQHIKLTNAYFLPDNSLLNALIAAARRGVDVQVLIPWNSNHPSVDWMARGNFSACLRNGVRIFGYNTMIHAKTCTIDGQWSTIGTANLDRLSSVGNFELNLEIYSQDLAQQMDRFFELDKQDAVEITSEHWESRPGLAKLGEKMLAPLRNFI
jgi:cardiolipin synthase